ncbi:MAG: alpha/beta hydrolase [Chloroflexota bacterium]
MAAPSAAAERRKRAGPWRLRLLLALATLLVPLVAGFVTLANTPLGPMPEAVAALQPDAQVRVETGRWLTFRPAASRDALTGLIIYPGGRVDPRSYAPLAHDVAREGHLAVIVPMPLNLAILGIDRATEVMGAFPAVQRWAIGVHSLGGTMAARYVYRHPGAVQGLVLWAAYPASSNDLSERDLAVVAIYGTADGLSTEAEIDAAHRLLPSTTEWVRIEGGNHAQFGWYGRQPGDNPATISREAQQQQALAATLKLLRQLD